MKSLWLTITKKGKLFFSELFKGKKPEKMERIVSFLAILELVRNNDITAEQKGSFEDILIEEKRK
jgi:segregation and condensation protein A